ncbi:MAG: hypothetical protein GC137_07640 [Alphaproteobacteria bacterium]|nr:hypothetical protein [Alphaproteobacteria bacterium]
MTKTRLQNPIITPQELNALISKKESADVKVLDATFVLPTSEENPQESFDQNHIPSAQFFDIKTVADPNSDLPHMLPPKDIFESALSKLGIENTDLVVIYGQNGWIMGPARAWWMFKVFGHENVVVLDGGLNGWKKYGFETTSDKSLYPISFYKASEPNLTLVVDKQEVEKISTNKTHPILDARPANRFSGETPEPRENMRAGHIPNSTNIPCSKLVNENGMIKSKEELHGLFQDLKLENETPERVITSCGSGVTACALTLALHHIGYKNVAVYDGSWSEWGRI